MLGITRGADPLPIRAALCYRRERRYSRPGVGTIMVGRPSPVPPPCPGNIQHNAIAILFRVTRVQTDDTRSRWAVCPYRIAAQRSAPLQCRPSRLLDFRVSTEIRRVVAQHPGAQKFGLRMLSCALIFAGGSCLLRHSASRRMRPGPGRPRRRCRAYRLSECAPWRPTGILTKTKSLSLLDLGSNHCRPPARHQRIVISWTKPLDDPRSIATCPARLKQSATVGDSAACARSCPCRTARTKARAAGAPAKGRSSKATAGLCGASPHAVERPPSTSQTLNRRAGLRLSLRQRFQQSGGGPLDRSGRCLLLMAHPQRPHSLCAGCYSVEDVLLRTPIRPEQLATWS